MADRITVRGAEAERIHDTGQALPRIEGDEFAAALGAEPCGDALPRAPSLLSLADLGNEVLKQLRPGTTASALADATQRCAAPLSREDVAALADIVAAIERATGARPALGQIARVVGRMHVEALRIAASEESPVPHE
jgi:hypothetical protein